jgi:hypothetical protein
MRALVLAQPPVDSQSFVVAHQMFFSQNNKKVAAPTSARRIPPKPGAGAGASASGTNTPSSGKPPIAPREGSGPASTDPPNFGFSDPADDPAWVDILVKPGQTPPSGMPHHFHADRAPCE